VTLGLVVLIPLAADASSFTTLELPLLLVEGVVLKNAGSNAATSQVTPLLVLPINREQLAKQRVSLSGELEMETSNSSSSRVVSLPYLAMTAGK
jgi:hypothetical protein